MTAELNPLLLAANRLDAEIEAGKGDRLRARGMALGSLFTEGRLPLPALGVEAIRKILEAKGKGHLLGWGILEQQGYTIKANPKLGRLVVGTGEFPEGPAPLPGSVIPVETGGAGGSEVAAGSEVAGARREVQVRRDYAQWQTHVRRQDIWELCQAERALEVGVVLTPWFVRYRGSVREWLGTDHPDAGRWAEGEIREDRVRAEPPPEWLRTFLAGGD